MRILSLLLLGLATQGMRTDDAGRGTLEAASARGFIVPRPGPVLVLPRDETLVYDARIELGPFSANVGTVTQRSKVEPYQSSLLLNSPDAGGEAGGETAHVSIRAKGRYTFYKMDSLIETRILPQEWPQVTYRMVSRGTEKRRALARDDRELGVFLAQRLSLSGSPGRRFLFPV